MLAGEKRDIPRFYKAVRPTHRAELEAMLKTGTNPAERAGSLRKLLSLPTHAGMAKDLAAVYQTVIRRERQAVGIDETTTETSWEETLCKVEAQV